MQQICLLGGTGSIGESTLDIIRQHPHRFQLRSVSGFRNIEKLAAIAAEFKPAVLVVPDELSRFELIPLGLSGS